MARQAHAAILSRAGPAEELVLDLAARDDWRAAIAELNLPEREAQELRVAVLRARVFSAVERGPGPRNQRQGAGGR